jgi:excisionase family DNA binding protein
MTELLNQSEAAQYLRVSERSLERWRLTGIPALPFVRLGRRILYRQTDLQEFVASQVRTSTSEARA